jgi:hypothetical protein
MLETRQITLNVLVKMCCVVMLLLSWVCLRPDAVWTCHDRIRVREMTLSFWSCGILGSCLFLLKL